MLLLGKREQLLLSLLKRVETGKHSFYVRPSDGRWGQKESPLPLEICAHTCHTRTISTCESFPRISSEAFLSLGRGKDPVLAVQMSVDKAKAFSRRQREERRKSIVMDVRYVRTGLSEAPSNNGHCHQNSMAALLSPDKVPPPSQRHAPRWIRPAERYLWTR